MNANTINPASAYTPSLPEVLVPVKIRNRFLATVLLEFNLNVLFSLVAVIPNRSASLISLIRLSKLAIGYADDTVPLYPAMVFAYIVTTLPGP